MPEVGHRLNSNWRAPAALQPRTSAASPPFFGFAPARSYDRAPVRLRSEQRWARRIGLGATAVAATALVAAVLGGGPAGSLLDRDRLASLSGFGIEQISLTGHRFTSDSDLFDALDLKTAKSLASFDATATGKRFEQLPWVQSAEIIRVWPGQLSVRITERKAFAIWERGDTASLIDATGRVLGPVKRDAELALPRFAGHGANIGAAGLWSALDRHPAIKSRVVTAERIGDRRWTLELTGGVRVHLPADGEATALARLASESQLASLIAAPGRIVDLRAPDRIAVRAETIPTPGAAPGPK